MKFSRFERQSLTLSSFIFISFLLIWIWIFLFATQTPIFAQVKGQPRPEDLPTNPPPPPPTNLGAALLQAGPDDLLPVIVRFVRPLALDDAGYAELLRQVGPFQTKHRYQIIPGMAGDFTAAQVRALSRHPLVEAVEYDAPVYAFLDGATYWFGAQDARVDFNVTGAGSSIAVIDTGIDPNHVDLDGGKIVGWKDFVNGKTSPYDDHGHGTHLSSIAAGTGEGNSAYTGVAPGASLVGVKVLNKNGSGTSSDVIAGIDWCVQNKSNVNPPIRVINLSLGTSGSSDGTDSLSVAVNNAVGAGLVACVAAGNSGPATYTIGSPAAAEKAITVGAMTDVKEKGFYQANFSSRGPTADGRIKPDASSPGVNITAAKKGTTNGYVTYSGTSMATPFVAGLVALMLQKDSSLTPLQVKDRIKGKAVDWDSAGADIDYGAGRLDGYAAVGNTTTSMPAVPTHVYVADSLPGTGESDWYDIPVATTAYPIAITLIMPNWKGSSDPDFDIYLYDPSGTAVAKSIGINRQEQIGYLPTSTGTYKLRVYSYAGSGSYFFDQSAGTGDTTPPVTSISLSGTAGLNGWYISDVSVTLSATDDKSGVKETKYSFDNVNWTVYTGPFTITTEGTTTVYFFSTDNAGNVESTKSQAVKIDKTAPSGSVVINSGATYTNTTSVTLTLSASDNASGVAEMNFSNDGTTFTAWEAYATTKTWSLTTGDGTKTVYAKFRDSAGHVSASASDDIVLDTTAPTGTVSINSGATYTTSTSVTLTLSASDSGSGVSQMRFSNDNATWTDWEPYATTKSWTLSTGDGTKTVYAQFKDNAGNVFTATDDIILDTTGPTGTVLINNGADYTNSASVTLNLSATDSGSGVSQMRFSDDNATWTAWEAYATTKSWTLPTGDGTKTVYAQFKDVVGFESSMVSDAIILDTVPPTAVTDLSAANSAGGVKLTWSAPSDSTSGTAAYDIRYSTLVIDDTNWATATQVSEEPTPAASGTSQSMTISGLNANTTYYFAMKMADKAGNISALSNVASVTTPSDSTPPVTSISLSGTLGSNGWYVSDVGVTLSATDDSSGVKETKYSFDNENWTVYAGAFTVSAEGTTTVYFYSTDNAGNVESTQSQSFKIDKTPPSTVTNLSATNPTDTSITLSWTAPSDTTSGTASYDIRYSTSPIDETNWSTAAQVSGEPAPAAAGTTQSTIISGLNSGTTYYIALKTIDNAGNTSALSNVPSEKTDTVWASADLETSVWRETGNKTGRDARKDYSYTIPSGVQTIKRLRVKVNILTYNASGSASTDGVSPYLELWTRAKGSELHQIGNIITPSGAGLIVFESKDPLVLGDLVIGTTNTIRAYIKSLNSNTSTDVVEVDEFIVMLDHRGSALAAPPISKPEIFALLPQMELPKRTALAQNYPNSFNPETWIPFALSKSERVTIRFYDVTGQLVRTLDLGLKEAGAYLTKDRAAYWDGRNQYGDMVSSGIYFYEMQAGSFRAIKKMVVLK